MVRSNLIGNVYPAYATYKAVAQQQQPLQRKWVTYWIVYTLFSVVESLGEGVLSWLPLYFEVKLLLILWLVLPSFDGASIMYSKLIVPFFTRYEQNIDEVVEGAATQAAGALGVALRTTTNLIAENQGTIVSGLIRGTAAMQEAVRATAVPPTPTSASAAAPSSSSSSSSSASTSGAGSRPAL